MDLNFKQILESPGYEAQKGIIAREINSNRIEVDYSQFKKSDEEWAQLYNLKSQWKAKKAPKPQLIGRYEF